MRQSEQGNVLFYILIAVVLLGALSFAVSRGTIISSDKISEDKAKIYATEIIEYANIIGSSVSQLRLRGCSVAQISFENDVTAGYTNASAPSNKTCHVFDPSGGSVEARLPDATWVNIGHLGWPLFGQLFFPSAYCVYNVGTDSPTLCENDGDEELLIQILYLDQEVCTQINNLLGVTNPSGNPPQNNQNSWPAASTAKYTGSFAGVQNIGGNGYTGDEGQAAGCYEERAAPMTGTYHFYKVFIAR